VLVTASILWLLAMRWFGSIQASEERYLRLFANSTQGLTVFRVTRDGAQRDLTVVDMNPVQSERQQQTPEMAVGRRLHEAGPMPERLRAHLEFVGSAVEGGSPARAELFLEEDGLYELLSAFPIGSDLWALAALDVTEVRKAEEGLRHQQEAIRQAYIDVLDAVTGGRLLLLPEEALREKLGEPLGPPQALESAAGLAGARRAVASATAARFPGWTREMELLSPVCEALTNALKHAGGGSYQVFARDDRVQVLVVDHGPGIDFRTLPKATLMAGYSTVASLGMGFAIMLQLCDRVLLTTGPGLTEVVLEESIEPPSEVRAGQPTDTARSAAGPGRASHGAARGRPEAGPREHEVSLGDRAADHDWAA
jgi:hypothetical protein